MPTKRKKTYDVIFRLHLYITVSSLDMNLSHPGVFCSSGLEVNFNKYAYANILLTTNKKSFIHPLFRNRVTHSQPEHEISE